MDEMDTPEIEAVQALMAVIRERVQRAGDPGLKQAYLTVLEDLGRASGAPARPPVEELTVRELLSHREIPTAKGVPFFGREQPILVCLADGEQEEILPVRAHPDDAAVDLRSAEEVAIPPGEVHTVLTGIKLAIPKGYEGQVRSRSGLASKHGVHVLNSPGTIDAGYRGIVGVCLHNAGKVPFKVSRGDRIAQLVIASVPPTVLEVVEPEDFPSDTERGEGGFGSTGR